MQIQIDFSIPHNRNGNQNALNTHRNHFEGQTKWVLEYLLTGKAITSVIAFNAGIMDVRARCYTLSKAGVKIEKEVMPGTNGSKRFYLMPEEIERVKKEFAF